MDEANLFQVRYETINATKQRQGEVRLRCSGRKVGVANDLRLFAYVYRLPDPASDAESDQSSNIHAFQSQVPTIRTSLTTILLNGVNVPRIRVDQNTVNICHYIFLSYQLVSVGKKGRTGCQLTLPYRLPSLIIDNPEKDSVPLFVSQSIEGSSGYSKSLLELRGYVMAQRLHTVSGGKPSELCL